MPGLGLVEMRSVLRENWTAEVIVNADANDATVEFGSGLDIHDSRTSRCREGSVRRRELTVAQCTNFYLNIYIVDFYMNIYVFVNVNMA